VPIEHVKGDRHGIVERDGGRFLLASARPLREPIARWGPFVMNTKSEIEQTLQELRNGTFIKKEPRDA